MDNNEAVDDVEGCNELGYTDKDDTFGKIFAKRGEGCDVAGAGADNVDVEAILASSEVEDAVTGAVEIMMVVVGVGGMTSITLATDCIAGVLAVELTAVFFFFLRLRPRSDNFPPLFLHLSHSLSFLLTFFKIFSVLSESERISNSGSPVSVSTSISEREEVRERLF